MSLLREVLTTGDVSTLNSSATPLTGDATFPGTSESTLQYAVLVVSVYSDVASATNGLTVSQSKDGTNWDHTDVFTIPAATGKTFSFQPQAEYFKVDYTNGVDAQSEFRLSVIKKKTYVKPSSHRIQDAISTEDDAELVKSVLTGEDVDGTFQNVQTTVDGNLSISDNSTGLSIAQGLVTGVSVIHKFGAAPDFDTGDNEITVWDGAEDGTAWELMNYVYSTTADIDSLSSSDNGDTVDMEIQGLDTNGVLTVQTITLTGQTRAPLTTSLKRVFRVKNVGATDLAGHVFVYVNVALTAGVPNTAANIRAIVQPENNQTEMVVYTIPTGYTGYMRSWYASTAGANKTSNYIMKVKARPLGQVFQLKHRASIDDLGTSHIQHVYVDPPKFDAGTDLEMTTQMLASTTAASISGGFDIVLVAD